MTIVSPRDGASARLERQRLRLQFLHPQFGPSPPSRGERDIVDFEHTTLGGKGFVPAVAGESFHLEAAETIRKIPIPRTETTVHRGCARMSSIAVVCSLHDSTLEAHGDDRAKEPATFSMQRER